MFFLFVFFTGLIALTFGVGLLVWSYRNQGKCVGFARVFGYIVLIGAILGLLCTVSKGMMYGKYYKKGFKPHAMLIQQQPQVAHVKGIRIQQ